MLMKIAITTSGLYTLSTGKLSSIMIPLPPIEEQQEIVKIINKKFNEIKFFQSMINELTLKQKLTIEKINHLQSSILDTAFSGKLIN